MHALEPLFSLFHHFFPFTFYFILRSFDLLPSYFDFFLLPFHSSPAGHRCFFFSNMSCLALPLSSCSSPFLATGLLLFFFRPCPCFLRSGCLSPCSALLLMKVCVRLGLHRGNDIMSHNLSSTSQRERAGYFSTVRSSLIINPNKSPLRWAGVHLLIKMIQHKVNSAYTTTASESPSHARLRMTTCTKRLCCDRGRCSNLQTSDPL